MRFIYHLSINDLVQVRVMIIASQSNTRNHNIAGTPVYSPAPSPANPLTCQPPTCQPDVQRSPLLIPPFNVISIINCYASIEFVLHAPVQGHMQGICLQGTLNNIQVLNYIRLHVTCVVYFPPRALLGQGWLGRRPYIHNPGTLLHAWNWQKNGVSWDICPMLNYSIQLPCIWHMQHPRSPYQTFARLQLRWFFHKHILRLPTITWNSHNWPKLFANKTTILYHDSSIQGIVVAVQQREMPFYFNIINLTHIAKCADIVKIIMDSLGYVTIVIGDTVWNYTIQLYL